jgi:hypothetical protein
VRLAIELGHRRSVELAFRARLGRGADAVAGAPRDVDDLLEQLALADERHGGAHHGLKMTR